MESLARYDVIGIAIGLIILASSMVAVIYKMWKDHTGLANRVVDVVEENGKKSTELSENVKANTKATERLEFMIDKTMKGNK